MKTSEAGINLIKKFEGLKHSAYKCPAGVWTVGYGSTGPHVKPGMLITSKEAEALLVKDLERFEDAVNYNATWPLTQNQFDACVCLAFNIGVRRFSGSTLVKYINQGNMLEAANQFLPWVLVDGKENAGLKRRRKAERELFLKA